MTLRHARKNHRSVGTTLLVLSLIFLVHAASLAAVPASMTLMAENELRGLYVNTTTTEFAILDKISGEVWHSTPPGSRSDRHKALLSLRYHGPGAATGTMDSFADAVEYGQFSIEPIEDGVRIEYQFGREYPSLTVLPVLISKERVDALLESIEDTRQRQSLATAISRNYTLFYLEEEPEDEQTTWSPSLQVFTGYRPVSPDGDLRSTDQQNLLRNLLHRIVANRAELERIDEVEKERFLHLLDNPTYILGDRTPAFMLRSVESGFLDAGYTMADRIADNEANMLMPPERRLEIFHMALELTLDGADLVARVPNDSISYPIDVVDLYGKYGPRRATVTLPITSIRVLESFGAASGASEGYIFVPDGSGAIIDFQRRPAGSNQYIRNIFGSDITLRFTELLTRREDLRNKYLHLPVFGLKENERAFLAIIEEGNATAQVRAALPSGAGTFGMVGSGFTLLPRGELSLTGQWVYNNQNLGFWGPESRVGIFQSRPNLQDLTIRYRFLNHEQANYSGMAQSYQEYLVERNLLGPQLLHQERPLFVELVGSIDKQANILGIPRVVDQPMTTFNQAAEIVSDLAALGLENVVIRYVGWFNGGYVHGYPGNIELVRRLGTAQEFTNLAEVIASHGYGFFPDVSFAYIMDDRSWFGGWSSRRDAARTLDRKQSSVVSPLRLDPIVTQFMSQYQTFGISGLSLRYLGYTLNSDFRDDPDLLVDRQQAQALVVDLLAKLRDKYQLDLLLRSPHSYVLPYTRYAIEVPFSSTNQDSVSRSIPFYQMVVHGFLDYAAEPINLAGDVRRTLLKTVEYGGSLAAQWSYAPSSAVKDTFFDHLYALHYKDWWDEVIGMYKEASAALNQVAGQRMVSHERLQPHVFRTAYENGYAVLVNYNSEPVAIDGFVVDALGFALVYGGEDVE